MRERLINRRQQGDLGEASAIDWFTRRGATVWTPLGHSPDSDLIAELGGRLFRVQVKTSTCVPKGATRWYLNLATNGGNQSWTGVTKLFDPSRFDLLFALVGDGRRWLIPADAIEGVKGITLGGRKYSEYEIQPTAPIAELVYGKEPTLESESRQGEYASGQSMRSVKAPANAFAGSNPASPIAPTQRPSGDSGDTTKFERSRGRSGQALMRPKRQTTIPKRPFLEAGLRVGDRMRVRADGQGRIVFERIQGLDLASADAANDATAPDPPAPASPA
jgi:hypothetical protein